MGHFTHAHRLHGGYEYDLARWGDESLNQEVNDRQVHADQPFSGNFERRADLDKVNTRISAATRLTNIDPTPSSGWN